MVLLGYPLLLKKHDITSGFCYNRHHLSTSDAGGEAVKMESNFYIFGGVKSYNLGKSEHQFLCSKLK